MGPHQRSYLVEVTKELPMRATLFATVFCLIGSGVVAAPPRTLTWQYEGYSQLPAAAAEAHRTRRRLLVGLSGSGT